MGPILSVANSQYDLTVLLPVLHGSESLKSALPSVFRLVLAR